MARARTTAEIFFRRNSPQLGVIHRNALFSVAAPANPFRNFGISEFQLFSILLNAYVKEPRMTRAIRPPPGLTAMAACQKRERKLVPFKGLVNPGNEFFPIIPMRRAEARPAVAARPRDGSRAASARGKKPAINPSESRSDD